MHETNIMNIMNNMKQKTNQNSKSLNNSFDYCFVLVLCSLLFAFIYFFCSFFVFFCLFCFLLFHFGTYCARVAYRISHINASHLLKITLHKTVDMIRRRELAFSS